MTDLIRAVVRPTIRFYQVAISPMLGQRCRFYPSCSQYTLECFERYGPGVALKKSLLRLSRCHPLHPGGIDLP